MEPPHCIWHALYFVSSSWGWGGERERERVCVFANAREAGEVGPAAREERGLRGGWETGER